MTANNASHPRHAFTEPTSAPDRIGPGQDTLRKLCRPAGESWPVRGFEGIIGAAARPVTRGDPPIARPHRDRAGNARCETSRAGATRTPPGPPHPFDLNLPDGSLESLVEGFARYGDVYALDAPGADAPIYVVSHPDHVKRILVTRHANYVKGIGIERVRLLLGDGLMASEDPLWRRQRTMIQPAFHRRALAHIEAQILAANRDLAARWARAAQTGEAVNATRDTSELSLGIVLRALLGEDLERMTAQTGHNPFALLTEESTRDLRFAARFRALRQPLRECIVRRRSQRTHVPDLLAMLMAARDRRSGAGMSEGELLDEVMTLIVAGHETTASALNWTWYLLAAHRDVEHALHRALEAGDRDYPRQVIEEALRLYPPGWLLTRRALGADEIGGYAVAPGTHIFIAPYLVHRHPGFWDNPDAFRPERFAAPACAERHRYAYLPFAAGPRRCVGEALAMMEMETHLRVIAGDLRLRRIDDTAPAIAAHVNLRTRQDLFLFPERRTPATETAR